MKLVGNTLTVNLLSTLQYLPLFALGATLAMHGKLLTDRLQNPPIWTQAALLVGSIALFSALKAGSFSIDRLKPFALLLVSALGATGLIAFAFSKAKLTNWVLTNRGTIFLGKISYSFYLTHLVVLQVLVRLLSSYLPMIAIVGLVLFTSIGLATLMQHLIERPSQRLGTWLSTRASAAPVSF